MTTARVPQSLSESPLTRRPHDGGLACSARRSFCVLRTTVGLRASRLTVPTESVLGLAGLLLVAAAFAAKLTGRRALLSWIERTGVGAEFFLEQRELSRPADLFVYVMGCGLKNRQHSTCVELHQPPQDGVTDLPRPVVNGGLEKYRQRSSVVSVASDEPSDRFVSDAPIVVSQAP